MQTCEIKELFRRSDEQITVREEKKQQVFADMKEELKGLRVPVMGQKEILLSQFLYMDKSFLYVYVLVVCLGMVGLFLLRESGVDVNTVIISCMIGASAFAVMAVLFIDSLFFGKMAELGASCYFSTKQCAAAYMVMVGSVNLVVLLLIILYVGNCWEIGVLRLGLYVWTAFFLSNLVSVGILSTGFGRENRYFLLVGGAFQAAGYIVFSEVPAAFYGTLIGAWGIACFVFGSLFVIQLKRLFSRMEKGELLCMN